MCIIICFLSLLLSVPKIWHTLNSEKGVFACTVLFHSHLPNFLAFSIFHTHSWTLSGVLFQLMCIYIYQNGLVFVSNVVFQYYHTLSTTVSHTSALCYAFIFIYYYYFFYGHRFYLKFLKKQNSQLSETNIFLRYFDVCKTAKP